MGIRSWMAKRREHKQAIRDKLDQIRSMMREDRYEDADVLIKELEVEKLGATESWRYDKYKLEIKYGLILARFPEIIPSFEGEFNDNPILYRILHQLAFSFFLLGKNHVSRTIFDWIGDSSRYGSKLNLIKVLSQYEENNRELPNELVTMKEQFSGSVFTVNKLDEEFFTKIFAYIDLIRDKITSVPFNELPQKVILFLRGEYRITVWVNHIDILVEFIRTMFYNFDDDENQMDCTTWLLELVEEGNEFYVYHEDTKYEKSRHFGRWRIANIHRQLGNYNIALDISLKLLEEADETKLDFGGTLMQLGRIYHEMEDHENCQKYFNEGLKWINSITKNYDETIHTEFNLEDYQEFHSIISEQVREHSREHEGD